MGCGPTVSGGYSRIPRSTVFRCQSFGTTGQHGLIGTDGNEGKAHFDIFAGKCLIRAQDTGRLAACLDALESIFNGSKDFRMLGIMDMSESGRQVTGSDEESVDAIGPCNLLEIFQPLAGLDLQDDADLLLADMRIILDAPEH